MAKKELHVEQFQPGQRDSIKMPELGVALAIPPDTIEPVDHPLIPEQEANLAFNEEWITIRIMPSAEEHAPTTVHCSVHGRCEWMEVDTQGHHGPLMLAPYLPVGRTIRIKRKYVEVLALSRKINVKTRVEKHEGEDRNPDNYVDRITTQTCSFSIIEDRSPKGREWLNRVIAGRY